MHDVVDVVHRAQQALLVADVADEPAQARVVAEELAHLVLLELVAREDDQPARVEVVEGVADERLAEGAGATRDEDVGAVEYGHAGVLPCLGRGRAVGERANRLWASRIVWDHRPTAVLPGISEEPHCAS